MMPWYAWAYLGLLCLIAAGRFTSEARGGHPWPALLRMGTVFVFGLGVVLYYRGSGAGMVFALALAVAIIVQARRARSDARAMQQPGMPPGSRLGMALSDLTLVPAALLGALAFWIQHSG